LQLNVDHQVLSNVIFLLSYVTCNRRFPMHLLKYFLCCLLLREGSCIGWKGALSSTLMQALDTCIHFFPTGDRCIRLAYDNSELMPWTNNFYPCEILQLLIVCGTSCSAQWRTDTCCKAAARLKSTTQSGIKPGMPKLNSFSFALRTLDGEPSP
jgi:hypothetical protein